MKLWTDARAGTVTLAFGPNVRVELTARDVREIHDLALRELKDDRDQAALKAEKEGHADEREKLKQAN